MLLGLMLLTLLSCCQSEFERFELHPKFESYFETGVKLDNELLEFLIQLGNEARVLLPYKNNDSPVQNEEEERTVSGLWHQDESESDVWGIKVSQSFLRDLQNSSMAPFLSKFSLASVEQLVQKQWLRLSRTRHLAKCVNWKLRHHMRALTLDSSPSTQELMSVDLIHFSQLHPSMMPIYNLYKERHDRGLSVPTVVSFLPRHRTIYIYKRPSLWENLTMIAYGGYERKKDFMIPEVPYVIPFGSHKLKDMLVQSSEMAKRRQILLSFFGSVNGNLLDNFLGYERHAAIYHLLKARDELSAARGSTNASLAALMAQTQIKHVFVTPACVEEDIPFQELKPAIEEHSVGNWDSLGQTAVLTVLAIAANSVFCFQPGGDTHLRHGLFDAWHMGCIPIIYDSAAELCASMFGGLLFRTAARMEDVVKIVSRDDVIYRTDDVIRDLLESLNDGRAQHMQASIRSMVDLTLMRLDSQHDAITLALGVARFRTQDKHTDDKLPPIPADYIELAERL